VYGFASISGGGLKMLGSPRNLICMMTSKLIILDLKTHEKPLRVAYPKMVIHLISAWKK